MLHFKRKYDKLETIYHYFRHFGTLSQRIKGEKNMFSRVLSAAICGIQGLPIFVEADVSEGLPGFSMVGDLSAKVKEAQDRVMTAFRNSGIQLRPKRITVNLSPADIHKDGSSYDLPVALAILAAYQLLPMENLKGVLVAGELGLNGAVKGIKGALPIVQLAKKKRMSYLYPAGEKPHRRRNGIGYPHCRSKYLKRSIALSSERHNPRENQKRCI